MTDPFENPKHDLPWHDHAQDPTPLDQQVYVIGGKWRPDCHFDDFNPMQSLLVERIAMTQDFASSYIEAAFIDAMAAAVRTPGAARAFAIYRDARSGGGRKGPVSADEAHFGRF